MDLSPTIKAIHSVHKIITTKSDADVIILYKGYDAGISKPFIARIDVEEYASITLEGALKGLLSSLKAKLTNKVKFAEEETTRLRAALIQLEN